MNIVENLVFNEDDTPEETEERYKIVEIYNAKLAERYQKRDFVISRGV